MDQKQGQNGHNSAFTQHISTCVPQTAKLKATYQHPLNDNDLQNKLSNLTHQARVSLPPVKQEGQRLRKVQYTWLKPQRVSALRITAFKSLSSRRNLILEPSRPQVSINRELANDIWDLPTSRYCAAIKKNKVIS